MENPLWIASVAGLGLSLASLSHCALMCGPIAAHAATGRGSARYLIGRFASYTLLGTVAGSVGEVLSKLGPARWIEALISWSIAVALSLTALRLLRPAGRGTALLQIGKKSKPGLVSRMLASLSSDPLLLGVASALLPCGVLYTALLAAAAQRSAIAGALTMAAFNVGSGVALFFVAELAGRVALRDQGRRVLGVLLGVGAVLLVLRPLPSLQKEQLPACHAHPGKEAAR